MFFAPFAPPIGSSKWRLAALAGVCTCQASFTPNSKGRLSTQNPKRPTPRLPALWVPPTTKTRTQVTNVDPLYHAPTIKPACPPPHNLDIHELLSPFQQQAVSRFSPASSIGRA
ncbi:hypothetical protein B0T14DRAFT_528215 [Immersiella caudata]|uniref:Uncharacterized protein n=1 Tax=Immersiella caudata TaxID=314043 RepID=A0AA39WF83_9PEZI|nr:hypothetical protein B0T14DRAFT_528215 [Immersiella caudata]